MRRLVFVTALSAAFYIALPTFAQTPTSKDNVKNLEAELDKLRSQIKDVEARLQKAKGDKQPASPWAQFGPWGKMDPAQMKKMMEQFGGKGGGFDPEQIKKMIELFQKMQAEPEKKEAKKDDKRPPSPWDQFGRSGSRGGWAGRDFRRPAEATKASDLDTRLERLLKEIEDIRREIKKK